MDANILNQFILSADQIFNQLGEFHLKKESLERLQDCSKVKARVATLLGLTGAIKGQVILTMEEPLAMQIASAILMGIEVNEYNEMAESGVCEMVNMIAGEASRRLHELGYSCDLSVPSIIRGDPLEIGMSPKTPIFLIRFATGFGPVQMLLGLELAQPK